MPVAADEPTYCYCGDVSYGEMIACENEVYTLYDGPDSSFVQGSGFIWTVLDWIRHQEGNGIVGIVNLVGTALEQGGSENGLSICSFLVCILEYDTQVFCFRHT